MKNNFLVKKLTKWNFTYTLTYIMALFSKIFSSSPTLVFEISHFNITLLLKIFQKNFKTPRLHAKELGLSLSVNPNPKD